MWRIMHIVAMGYPVNPRPEHKKAYREFFMSLATVLPCGKCAAGFAKIAAMYPIDDALSNGTDLFNWTVVVHNEVAKKLGQPAMTPEFVRSEYVFGDAPPPDAEDTASSGSATKSKVSKKDYAFSVACSAAVILLAALCAWFVVDRL